MNVVPEDNILTRLADALEKAAETAIDYISVYGFGLLALGLWIKAGLGLLSTGKLNMALVILALVFTGIAVQQGVIKL